MFWFTASSDNTTQYIISVILPTKAGNGQFNSFWSGKKDECCYIRLEECLLSGRVDESCSPLTVPWVLQVQLQMFDYMSTVEAAVMSYQTVYHKYNICICKWLREEQTIQLCVCGCLWQTKPRLDNAVSVCSLPTTVDGKVKTRQ